MNFSPVKYSTVFILLLFCLFLVGSIFAASLTKTSGSLTTKTVKIPQKIIKVRPKSNPMFVAVGSKGYFYYSDNNGSSWTQCPKLSAQDHNAVAFGAGRFVTAGYNGDAWYSSDGKTWKFFSFPAGNFHAITYGGGHFVAVGDDGRIVYSSNGIAWNNSTYQGQKMEYLGGVAYGKGRFVAVGYARNVLYSDNGGRDWQKAAIPYYNFRDIAFGDNYFVAVGGSQQSGGKSTVIASSNGTTWMAGNSGTTKILDTIAYDPNSKRFIAGGRDGIIITSDNLGATWISRNSKTTNSITDIIWGNGCLLAVGYKYSIDGSDVSSSTNGGLNWTANKSGMSTIYGAAFRP